MSPVLGLAEASPPTCHPAARALLSRRASRSWAPPHGLLAQTARGSPPVASGELRGPSLTGTLHSRGPLSHARLGWETGLLAQPAHPGPRAASPALREEERDRPHPRCLPSKRCLRPRRSAFAGGRFLAGCMHACARPGPSPLSRAHLGRVFSTASHQPVESTRCLFRVPTDRRLDGRTVPVNATSATIRGPKPTSLSRLSPRRVARAFAARARDGGTWHPLRLLRLE
jgi:hypothetical protein